MAASAKVSRQPRDHSQLTLWSVATVAFALGSLATALIIWQLHRLYRATIAPEVMVKGTVQARYSNQPGDGPMPAPTGYFIESAGIDRVYLTGKPLNSYVGQVVEARGGVSGTCGPKSIPCYPLIEVREVAVAAQEESKQK